MGGGGGALQGVIICAHYNFTCRVYECAETHRETNNASTHWVCTEALVAAPFLELLSQILVEQPTNMEIILKIKLPRKLHI